MTAKQYAYFPGCSSKSTARALGISTEAVAVPLGLDLKEIEDWNCCGSTPYGSMYEDEALIVAARNLALAEKTGNDLVTPCSNCFVVLNGAAHKILENEKLQKRVNEALAVADLEFKGKIGVRLLTEVLYHDVTPEGLAGKVKKNLNGLKVASFYGCQMVRPYGFENPETPQSLDKLVESMGGTPVKFPMKNRCCGASHVLTEETETAGLMRNVLASAAENGADCVITPCPLCQTNLDAYQERVNTRFETSFQVPVLFVTQLIGISLGLDAASLGLDANIISTASVLEKINAPKPAPEKSEVPAA